MLGESGSHHAQPTSTREEQQPITDRTLGAQQRCEEDYLHERGHFQSVVQGVARQLCTLSYPTTQMVQDYRKSPCW